ncbi:MAG: hypothetical protein P1Q69_13510, partial [Candidatus Thorarchaeota archaeon]|nr:hypothetical protein [Candidatus Thorarchaeota archaeon]
TKNEFTVFKTLIDFLIQDGVVYNQKSPQEKTANSNEGFRNKHKIIKASGVEQSLIYNTNGVLERFVELKIAEEGNPLTGWGGQKNVYRINIEHQLVRAYLNTALNE